MSERDHQGSGGGTGEGLPPEVAELLFSRLCHDLVSPVGAVNNGMELLRGEDPGAENEIMDMIANSGHEAAARLKFFRAAYGRGGEIDGLSHMSPVHEIAAGLFTGTRVRLVWPESGQELPRPLSKQATKLLLNLILLAAAVLPLGGDIVVRLEMVGDSFKAEVSAVGERAALNDVMKSTISGTGDVKDLEPATVQAYFTAYLSRIGGGKIAVSESAGEGSGCATIHFSVTLD